MGNHYKIRQYINCLQVSGDNLLTFAEVHLPTNTAIEAMEYIGTLEGCRYLPDYVDGELWIERMDHVDGLKGVAFYFSPIFSYEPLSIIKRLIK